jgi:hypothetical protein
MTDQTVTFEVASLAKKAGFDWETTHAYVKCVNLKTELYTQWHNKHDHATSAPTQSLLQRWLREKDIHIVVEYLTLQNVYQAGVKYKTKIGWQDTFCPPGDTYEGALEAALKAALELL